jgi:hypothetical protein
VVGSIRGWRCLGYWLSGLGDLLRDFDNFLRPMLIRKGADLPLLLIFAGVIGGLIAFGVIGLSIGPVVLAVAYSHCSSMGCLKALPPTNEGTR